jgi:hypothetical protein
MSEFASTHHSKEALALPWQKLVLVQYLQLQDRVTEAIELFKGVPLESLPEDGTLRI